MSYHQGKSPLWPFLYVSHFLSSDYNFQLLFFPLSGVFTGELPSLNSRIYGIRYGAST
ncbi:MAG: hypothetical protein ACFFFT_16095 [Candidatus Thorarchaeota archaeon]